MLTWSDVGVVIRAVPRRRADRLARIVAAVASFTDEYDVSYHRKNRTVAESYADALGLWTSPDRRWTLQFEDDAIVCPGFGDLALSMLDSADREGLAFVSLYSGRRVGENESAPPPGGYEVLPGSRFMMAQCIAIRTDLAGEHNRFVVDFCDRRPLATDVATGRWMASKRMRYARAWPSLVQHDDGGESLYGHRRHPNRVSESFNAAFPGFVR